MDRNYGGVIWTNHALDRLRERRIKQGDAWAAFKRPDHKRRGQAKDSWISYRTFGGTKIEVVTKKNENNEWLILSVWSKTKGHSPLTKPAQSIIYKLIKFIFG